MDAPVGFRLITISIDMGITAYPVSYCAKGILRFHHQHRTYYSYCENGTQESPAAYLRTLDALKKPTGGGLHCLMMRGVIPAGLSRSNPNSLSLP